MDPALVIGVLINFGLSFIVASIAERKGRSFGGFWWLSFLLSFLIGILVVIAIPDESKRTTVKAENNDALRVKCSHCAEEILAEASVCKHCGRDVIPRTDLLIAAEEQKQNAAIAEAARKVDSEIRSKRGNRISVAITFYIMGTFTFFLTLAVASQSSIGLIVLGSVTVLMIVIASLSLYKLHPKPGEIDFKSVNGQFKK